MADTLFDNVQMPAAKDRREAVYFRTMDYILYLRQDSAYVADRIDESLTLLRDPISNMPIGVKLKGFHNIYLNMKTILATVKVDLERRIPFRTFISLAETVALQLGDDMLDDTARLAQYDAYKVARDIVGSITVSADEFKFVEPELIAA